MPLYIELIVIFLMTLFLEVNGMKLPDMCKEQSTFYHFNNRDKSQIDYFVESNLRVKKILDI